MRLLLDEMLSVSIARALRSRGQDVIGVQDPGQAHLRSIDDCVLLDRATVQQRAVVTDNVPDFLQCHRQRLDAGERHYGLLLFTNDAFPRHRHELFVSHLIASLAHQLQAQPQDDDSAWMRWLARSPEAQ